MRVNPVGIKQYRRGIHAGSKAQAAMPAITGKSRRKNGVFPIKAFIICAPEIKGITARMEKSKL
jgi:hypothetical protein